MTHYNRQQQDYPPPPPSFYLAIRAGKRIGLYVKTGRYPKPGQARYVVTPAGGSEALFISDDADEVLAWVRTQA